MLLLQAPAKINFCLSVGRALPAGSTDRFAESGTRDISGYHPIASWFEPIALFDEIEVERLDPDESGIAATGGASSSFDVEWAGRGDDSWPVEWPIERDLTFRAHGLMERSTARALPVRVRVRKFIPAGGGLAGGSSDAAAVMMALAALFELEINTETLREWSMRLGSDIAYFIDEPVLERLRSAAALVSKQLWIEQLSPRPALVTGLGERIERIGTPRADLVLYLPPFGCPTGQVYKSFDAADVPVEPDEVRVRSAIERCAQAGRIDPSALFNDLTIPALVAAPELGPLMAELGADTPVHMSGSGSTLFSIGRGLMRDDRATTPERVIGRGVRVIHTATLV